jgi:ribonuclease H2 subunit A
MVYGMAFWNENDLSKETTDLRAAFGDSKQLTEEKREMLFQKILSSSQSTNDDSSSIGFGVKILHASEISRHMLRRSSVYNLNQMSHDAAMALIRSLQQQLQQIQKSKNTNASISTCYIDTVGNPQTYQRQLERAFPGIRFVVESKADDTYPPCSAASIGTLLSIPCP